jgi:hypothetical protein
MNVTVLHGYSHWVLDQGDHVGIVWYYLFGGKPAQPPAPTSVAPQSQPAAAPASVANKAPTPPGQDVLTSRLPINRPLPLAPLVTVRKLAERLFREFTAIYAILIVVGVWLWRRVFFRRDQQAVLLLNVLLIAAVGVRLSEGLGIDMRYFLPCVITMLPYAALTLLAAIEVLTQLTAARVTWSPTRRGLLCCGLAAIVVTAGYPDRSNHDRHGMAQHADLGKWLRGRYGANLRLAGHLPEMRLVSYYADAEEAANYQRYRYLNRDLPAAIADCKPDVLLLWSEPNLPDHSEFWRGFLDDHPEFGLRRLSSSQLPPSCREEKRLVIAVRKDIVAKER